MSYRRSRKTSLLKKTYPRERFGLILFGVGMCYLAYHLQASGAGIISKIGFFSSFLLILSGILLKESRIQLSLFMTLPSLFVLFKGILFYEEKIMEDYFYGSLAFMALELGIILYLAMEYQKYRTKRGER